MAYFNQKKEPKFRGKLDEKKTFAGIAADNHFWADVD